MGLVLEVSGVSLWLLVVYIASNQKHPISFIIRSMATYSVFTDDQSVNPDWKDIATCFPGKTPNRAYYCS